MKRKVTYLCWLLLACLLLAACQPASDPSPIDTQPDTAPESTETGDNETGDNETGGNETGDNETEPETDPIPEDVLVLFKTLHVNDKHISGEVAADTSSFSFEDEVVLAKNVVYSVSTDPDGNIIIPSKTVDLNHGENTFYIAAIQGERKDVFTVEIYRRKIVSVKVVDNGKVLFAADLEEGVKISIPEIEDQIGKTFDGWDYDIGNLPIYSDTENLVINAKWEIHQEMTDFKFTSTDKTCVITGIEKNASSDLTIPDFVTTIADNAFSSEDELRKVVISNGVTSIGNRAFSGCENLTEVQLPNSIREIGERVFSHCTSLADIVIPEGVTAIERSAFSSCSRLTDIVLPSTLVTIGELAFGECTGLESIVIPTGVTSIGGHAFQHCDNMTSATLPATVTEIGVAAFAHTGLTEIQFEGTMAQWNAITLKAGWAYETPLEKIVCTDGTISMEN